MAQFRISQGDASYNVTVPDEFLNLPQDQQHSQLAAAFTQHAGGASAQPASPPPEAPPDTSLAGALGYGVDNTAHSLGNTAEVLGMGGKTLQGVHMAPKNYQPVSLTGDIAGGKWSSLPGDLVRKGAEMLPAVGGLAAGGALTAAAAPEALAAGVGLGASALGSAALHYGDNVKASAANNGDAQPTTGDYIRGAVTTVPQAALDAVGLRVPGLSKVASSALGKATVRSGADAATGAVSDQVGQIGTSIGTQKGLQDDPQQSLEAGLGALPARAMTTAPGLAKAAIKSTADSAMSHMVAQPADIDHAGAIEQANQAMDSARASIKGDAPPTTVANSAKSQIAQTLQSTFRALRLNYPELITADDSANFNEALNQARRHNNAIGEGGNPDVATLLDQVGSLPLPTEATGPLVQGLRALDVLSNASFANQTVGPFRAAGRLASQAAAIGGGFAGGGPVGGMAVLGGMLAGGSHVVGSFGANLGGVVDRALGTATPVAVLQRAAAQRMLGKANAPTPGDPVAALQAIRSAAIGRQSDAAVAGALSRAGNDLRSAGINPTDTLGNPPDPVPVNTPIPQAPQAPPAAPQPQAPQPQPQAPQPAPQGPQGSPGGIPPWMRYVMNGSSRITPAHVDQAIDAHVADGGMTPLQAAQLRAHPGVEHPSILAPIQTKALQAAGVGGGPEAVGLPTSGQSGVRNPLSYAANLRQEAATAANIAALHPELANAVNAIRDPIANAKTAAGRQAIMTRFLDDVPEGQRAAVESILKPLTSYGQK